jgi:glyoxylase-like metal-dependent hydrolase (beta-lactamase superfamily II)
MATRITVGDITLVGATDGVESTPFGLVYTNAPADAGERFRAYLDEAGNIPFNFASFAVEAGGQTLLIDTGWGPKVPYLGEPHGGMLIDELKDVGIAVEDVAVVAFTHLHVDHVGWNLTREGSPAPVFPRARYLVPAADWDFFAAGLTHDALPERGGDRSFDDQVRPLRQMGLLDFISYDRPLFPGVTAVHTPGHTPGHTSFVVQAGEDIAYILGDVAISPADAIDDGLVNQFDEDTDVARETRRRVIPQLERDGTLVAAAHFPRPGIGRFQLSEAGRLWVPAVLE